MINHEEIVRVKALMTQLLDALNTFSSAEKEEVILFTQAGEYGLAVETAFQIITEEKKTISHACLQIITDLVDLLEMTTLDLSRLSASVGRFP